MNKVTLENFFHKMILPKRQHSEIVLSILEIHFTVSQ